MAMQTGDFEYHKDKEKTESNRIGKLSPSATSASWTRTASSSSATARRHDHLGRANIYPAEIESVLLMHPRSATQRSSGSQRGLGEEVKAVIEPAQGVEASDELERRSLVLLGQAGQVQDAQVDRLHRRDAS